MQIITLSNHQTVVRVAKANDDILMRERPADVMSLGLPKTVQDQIGPERSNLSVHLSGL